MLFSNLGKSKIDEKTVEELSRKNREWEEWKAKRNIKQWKPPRQKANSFDRFFSAVAKKRPLSPERNTVSSSNKKSKSSCKSARTKVCPLSPRKSNIKA